MNNEFYIHVGYPKAASTTLQKHLFSKHSEVVNLSVFPTKNIGVDSDVISNDVLYLNSSELRSLHNDLVSLDDIEFHYSRFYERSKSYIDRFSSGNKFVFSNEKLTSVFFSHKDNGVKATRLAKAFPGAKIIFILRNQHDWLRSQYRDHPFDPRELVIGGSVDFDKWFRIVCWHEQVKLKGMLDYYSVIKYYEYIFGKENIGVFLFEELASDLKKFSDDLSLFMGVDKAETYKHLLGQRENSGVSNSYNTIRALQKGPLRKIIPAKLIDWLLDSKKTGRKIEYQLSDENTCRLLSLYGGGNRNLISEYGVDLGKYGYPLEDVK